MAKSNSEEILLYPSNEQNMIFSGGSVIISVVGLLLLGTGSGAPQIVGATAAVLGWLVFAGIERVKNGISTGLFVMETHLGIVWGKDRESILLDWKQIQSVRLEQRSALEIRHEG